MTRMDRALAVLLRLSEGERSLWYRRVSGPWTYKSPSPKDTKPMESWVRPNLSLAPLVSVYRTRPNWQMEDEEASPTLEAMEGTEVFWVLWDVFHDNPRPCTSARDLPRTPASSVAEAMEAADLALVERGRRLLS